MTDKSAESRGHIITIRRGLCRCRHRRRRGRGGDRQNSRTEGFSYPMCVYVCVAGVELGLLRLNPNHVGIYGVG